MSFWVIDQDYSSRYASLKRWLNGVALENDKGRYNSDEKWKYKSKKYSWNAEKFF